MSTDTLALVIALGIVVWACYRTASEFTPDNVDGLVETLGVIVMIAATLTGLVAAVGLTWITFAAWAGG